MACGDISATWRMIGEANELRKRRCTHLTAVSSDRRGSALHLVLAFVPHLNTFYAMDGICGHMGMPDQDVDYDLNYSLIVTSLVL